MATNDDNAQRGILSFYDLPSGNESIALQLTIINRKWQSFTNFGNKIVIGDFNGDSYNDVLVTSPTSKWLDLPEVGHAHLFINTKSETFFTDTSTIIRGLPIAHSFFGWNAKTVGDLDGDGVKDFLIAALKVSESDLRGGIYVYLGSADILIRGLTYYEIIQPSMNLENELTGFGFFISSKMVLDREGNSYVMMSRVFSGEVDVYKISSRFPIKVSVIIEPNRFTVDEKITFEKNCPQNECFEDYTVGLLNDPIWNQQTEEPILFSLTLTNKGDFLTHLIIDASLSMDCKIIIPNMEIVPIINSEPFGLKPKKSNIRVIYKQPTSHLGTFDFIVQALCPQVHSQISDPVLKLSIQSFLTGDTKKFEFTAKAEYKVEFLIEAMALPVVSKRVCRHSETEENVEFNIEVKKNLFQLFIGGAYYDNNLLLSAVLYIGDSAGASVMSLDIKVGHLSKHPHDRVTHNFKITKAFNVQNIRLSLSYKMMIKPTKDFHMTLKVEPVLESDSPYKLKSIMANEAEYIVMISFQFCHKERLVMTFLALGCAILIFCCLILLYYKIVLPRYIVPRQDLTFIISNFEIFDGY
ncbi:Integrin alpha-4 [Thelohanellus kitauei]|uniref:Integrin alpha-4 n=1 Tax=Thelohanellus kitauei TaxID=669202 RepID=A0A0C2IY29_THEKT|nr:Integrin alpha-4 [Thelohanellus kitauei]